MKPIRAEDETGQSWVVYEGDPVWPHVRALSLAGAAHIVLPRDTICSGALTDYHNSVTISTLDVSRASIARLAARLVRLKDCLYVLRRSEHSGANRLYPGDAAGEDTALAAD